MGVKEEAIRLRGCGFNCGQSVLASLRDYTGLEDKTALAISGGFGGGVRCGEICGALCGAVMAIGMAFPHTDGGDAAARANIRALAEECTVRFREEFGCLRCRDLKANMVNCQTLIERSAQLAENIILEN